MSEFFRASRSKWFDNGVNVSWDTASIVNALFEMGIYDIPHTVEPDGTVLLAMGRRTFILDVSTQWNAKCWHKAQQKLGLTATEVKTDLPNGQIAVSVSGVIGCLNALQKHHYVVDWDCREVRIPHMGTGAGEKKKVRPDMVEIASPKMQGGREVIVFDPDGRVVHVHDPLAKCVGTRRERVPMNRGVKPDCWSQIGNKVDNPFEE